MPLFSYKGRNGAGELIKGLEESQDSKALANKLFSNGITPVEISISDALRLDNENVLSIFAEPVETIDIMMFSRQMYTLLKAGIPIMQALNGLQASTNNKTLAKVISDIGDSLDSGREMSAALSQHPKIFSNFYVSMIRVGETTGMLEAIFLRLFEHLEFEKFMKDQIKSALRYPTFVVIAMAIAIVIVNIFVIPSFAKVFQSFGAELPLMTRLLLGFSNFMLHSWAYMMLGAIIIIFLFRYYVATISGRYNWDSLKLRIPIAGKIIHKGTLARFARSFALSSKSGLPILNSLTLISQTTDNQYIARKIEEMRLVVERGESIFRAASKTGVFNPMVLQMIAVGEESGALDDLMQEVAEMYQSDVEYEIKTLGAQIEPILIVFLGILVLILALGIFLPIWDLSKVALHRG